MPKFSCDKSERLPIGEAGQWRNLIGPYCVLAIEEFYFFLCQVSNC